MFNFKLLLIHFCLNREPTKDKMRHSLTLRIRLGHREKARESDEEIESARVSKSEREREKASERERVRD